MKRAALITVSIASGPLILLAYIAIFEFVILDWLRMAAALAGMVSGSALILWRIQQQRHDPQPARNTLLVVTAVYVVLLLFALPPDADGTPLTGPFVIGLVAFLLQLVVTYQVGFHLWPRRGRLDSPNAARKQTTFSFSRVIAYILIIVAVFIIVYSGPFGLTGAGRPSSSSADGPDGLVILMAAVAFVLALLFAVTAAQWAWRRRFAVRRGAVLLGLWGASIVLGISQNQDCALWAALPGMVIVSVGFALAWKFHQQRQRQAVSPPPTPEQLNATRVQHVRTLRGWRRKPEVAQMAGTFNNLGVVYGQIEQPKKARAVYEMALTLYRQGKDRAMQSIVLNNLGMVLLESEPQEALTYYQEALAIRRGLSRQRGLIYRLLGFNDLCVPLAGALNNVGAAYLKLEKPAEALPYYEEALALIRVTEDAASTCLIQGGLGFARGKTGDTEAGVALIEEAMVGFESMQPPPHGLDRLLVEWREKLAEFRGEAPPPGAPAADGDDAS